MAAGGCYAIADGTPSRHAVRGDFDRPEGTLRLAYDDTYLYFAIDQADAVFKTRPGASIWDADGLQIGVSVPQKFMIRPNNDGIQETAYAGIRHQRRRRSAEFVGMGQHEFE